MLTNIVSELKDRGFFHQCSDEAGMAAYFTQRDASVYIGFDCTAACLHAGSLVPIMLLRLLRRHGVRPIVLTGGGTTRIGDPSGKDATRQILDNDAITENTQKIRDVLARFIGDEHIDGPEPLYVDNADWLMGLNYVEFLREVGPHFSINRMLTFDSVKTRLEREQTLSFLEFNYMILQAYDFVQLHRVHGCRLQAGGSDQWGNIVNGLELSRRLSGGEAEELYGFTTPLLTTSNGKKMGKTEQGAVWLDASMYSPYDYRQYWRNCDDRDVGSFLRLFTELSNDEILSLESGNINDAKERLADEATRICHGAEAAERARDTAHAMFRSGGIGADTPAMDISAAELTEGLLLTKALIALGMCSTGGEAKRLMQGGGVKVNDEKETDGFRLLTTADISDKGYIKLSVGKKKIGVVRSGG